MNMDQYEMDLLIAQQRDRINELVKINTEMREYIQTHTRMDSAARRIEDAVKQVNVAIVAVDYHFALERLYKAVAASAGLVNSSGHKFLPELEAVRRARGGQP
jgi:hypothetical protein